MLSAICHNRSTSKIHVIFESDSGDGNHDGGAAGEFIIDELIKLMTCRGETKCHPLLAHYKRIFYVKDIKIINSRIYFLEQKCKKWTTILPLHKSNESQ